MSDDEDISEKTMREALKRARELAAKVKRRMPERDERDEEREYESKRFRAPPDYSMALVPTQTAMQPALAPGTCMEAIEVPDSCVGLVIGRGGENVSSMQAASGCRIQMAPNVVGQAFRSCTLQGTREAITLAKQMIDDIVERGLVLPPPGQRIGGGGGGGGGPYFSESTTREIMIPSIKCGLIIGRGGETIKEIQDRTGVKMDLIRNMGESAMDPKPLRFIGDPEKIEVAMELVRQVMDSKDDNPGGRSRDDRDEYGSSSSEKPFGEVIVPRSMVGTIIGRGGETINQLCADSGARIQFRPDEDHSLAERTCVIYGTHEQIKRATGMITTLVGRSLVDDDAEGQLMRIPYNKTGVLIGYGGETIRSICNESGASVERARDVPATGAEKVFVIKGTPKQMEHAEHLIRVTIGDLPEGSPFTAGRSSSSRASEPRASEPRPLIYSGSAAAASTLTSAAESAVLAAATATNADPQAMAAQWAQYYAQYAAVYQQQMAAASTQQSDQQTAEATKQWADYYRSLGMAEQADAMDKQVNELAGKGKTTTDSPGPAAAAAPAAPTTTSYATGFTQGVSAGQASKPSRFAD